MDAAKLKNRWIPLIVFGILGITLMSVGTDRLANAQNSDNNEPQVLTRGPVHEAFAEPVVFDAKPGPIVSKRPPAAVEELPPDEKPEGENVAWIPGYWQWDDDRKDFLWVSGFWRVMPPGRQWVPGYWNNLESGEAQWVSGYWSAADAGQIEYLPAPPGSLETGAPSDPPTDNHTWVPGSWVWRETRYLWRPGYWIVCQPGWIWTPAHYVYTPCGYVYVDGYWDYSIRRRGVLFAPIYWSNYVYRPAYVYRPLICIDVDILTTHFFCRPAYHHYYFGDYYGSTYVSLGFSPWFQFRYTRGSGYYCPIYSYHAWYYRNRDPRWEVNLQVGYRRAFNDVSYRPPRTYVAQQNIINNVTINNTVVNNNVNRVVIARPLNEITANAAKDKGAPMHFQKLDEKQVRQFRSQGQETRDFIAKRGDIEKKTAANLPRMGTGTNSTTKITQPVKLDLPKTPIVSRRPTTPPPSSDLGSGGAATGGSTNRPNVVKPGGSGSNSQSGGNMTLPGGGKPPVTPPTGGGSGAGGSSGGGKPPITPPTGGGKPPVTPPTGGGSGAGGSSGGGKPPITPPTGGGKPPVVPPTGGGSGASGSSGGGKPPITPPTGGGKPPVVPPTGGGSGASGSSGGGKPPAGNSGSGNRPPSGSTGSGKGSGGSKPPSSDGNKPPSDGGNRGNKRSNSDKPSRLI